MFVGPKNIFETSFTNLSSPKKLLGSAFLLGQDRLAQMNMAIGSSGELSVCIDELF